MKLVIDRQRWLRGTTDSFLRRSDDGMMCCLGFYSLAVGIKPCEIDDIGVPNEVCDSETDYPDWVFKNSDWNSEHSDDIQALMRVNDSMHLSESQREDRIRDIFARNGVEVEFVG